MRQQNNKTFYRFLTKTRKKLFNNDNINTLNSRIACSISTKNINKNIVII